MFGQQTRHTRNNDAKTIIDVLTRNTTSLAAAAAAEEQPSYADAAWTLRIRRRAAWSADHAGMPRSGVAFRASARRARRWVATGGLAVTHPPHRRRRTAATRDGDGRRRSGQSLTALPTRRFFSQGRPGYGVGSDGQGRATGRKER